ncbi:MAG: SpoIIIAH-like family protein [Clostridia bacterium]|nr:SpoIIIAH-like family protein [Clostridia bacterium]
MKKKKVFGKKQVLMAGLMLALAGAVWLNMEYSSGAGGFVGTNNNTSSVSDKNLGDTQYVANETEQEVTETAAPQADYFTTARSDRKKARDEALALLKETANDVKASEGDKAKANEKIAEIAGEIEKENAIESLVKAKGFEEAVAVIGEDNITVIVKSEELLASQTLQIQDAVTSQTDFSLEKIKIVAIK